MRTLPLVAALALAPLIPSGALAQPQVISLKPAATRAGTPVEAFVGSVHSSTYRLFEVPFVAETLDALPAKPKGQLNLASLRELLPGEEQVVGDIWEIPVDPLLPLLRQLHPGVSKRLMHRGPAIEGGRATLLKRSASELHLLVRVHVEFTLAEDRLWLLPAQFEGHLIWDLETDAARAVHLALPPRNTNYDMRLRKGASRMTADIGFLTRMEVRTSGAASAGLEHDPARRALARRFYRSEAIRWTALADAREEARRTQKKLVVLQLFGTLDDESC